MYYKLWVKNPFSEKKRERTRKKVSGREKESVREQGTTLN